MPDLDTWDLQPLVEGIHIPNDPNSMEEPAPNELIRDAEIVYMYCHENRHRKPEAPAQPGTNTIIYEKEIIYIEKRIDTVALAKEHGHKEEDHDCPVCNAARPKKPTVALYNAAMGTDQSV